MENDIEPQTDKFANIELNLVGLDDDMMHMLIRNYFERNMTAASLSKFDEIVDLSTEDSRIDLNDAIVYAVFNEAVIQAIEAGIKTRNDSPIPPFNI